MGRREGALRQSVVEALEPLGAIAVENPVLPGTPDVNYVEGWIELKCIERWPARHQTIVRVDHFTPQQRVFHVRRTRAGGETWLLLEACEDRDYLLLQGATAAKMIGRATRRELTLAATATWHGKADCRAGLLQILSRCSDPTPPTQSDS
jgi:hypothetical protein